MFYLRATRILQENQPPLQQLEYEGGERGLIPSPALASLLTSLQTSRGLDALLPYFAKFIHREVSERIVRLLLSFSMMALSMLTTPWFLVLFMALWL